MPTEFLEAVLKSCDDIKDNFFSGSSREMYLVHIFDEWYYNERLLTCMQLRFSHELYMEKSLQIISCHEVSGTLRKSQMFKYVV